METKTSKAIRLFQAGDYKAAFRLFSGFKIGFSPDERRKMQIAYECVTDLKRCSFYESIGVDYRQECTDAWCIIMDKYILKQNEQDKKDNPHM